MWPKCVQLIAAVSAVSVSQVAAQDASVRFRPNVALGMASYYDQSNVGSVGWVVRLASSVEPSGVLGFELGAGTRGPGSGLFPEVRFVRFPDHVSGGWFFEAVLGCAF